MTFNVQAASVRGENSLTGDLAQFIDEDGIPGAAIPADGHSLDPRCPALFVDKVQWKTPVPPPTVMIWR